LALDQDLELDDDLDLDKEGLLLVELVEEIVSSADLESESVFVRLGSQVLGLFVSDVDEEDFEVKSDLDD
jgi:hypothetical protein